MYAWIVFVSGAFFAALGVAGVLRGEYRRLGKMALPFWALSWCAKGMPLQSGALALLISVPYALTSGGTFSAPGRWGLVLTGLALALLATCHARATRLQATFDAALRSLSNSAERADERSPGPPVDAPRPRAWLRPGHFRTPAVETIRNIAYGPAGERNLLDIYRPAGAPAADMPVLLQVHGGGWTMGDKAQQALPLMHYLAGRGWICVAINYRLGPTSRYPEFLIDVKMAIAWIRENIVGFGGDAGFIAITGGSAGGHIASLAALTPNESDLQPGFESVDTALATAVPLYGRYDFLDRGGHCAGSDLLQFLAANVMPCSHEQDRALWERASPLSLVRPDAPPFFVVHGSHDCLIPVAEGADFVQRLRAVSRNPVLYAELSGAEHAFDIMNTLWTTWTVRAIYRFLDFQHRRYRATVHTAATAGCDGPVAARSGSA
jgi:acetyl esterase/lipase